MTVFLDHPARRGLKSILDCSSALRSSERPSTRAGRQAAVTAPIPNRHDQTGVSGVIGPGQQEQLVNLGDLAFEARSFLGLVRNGRSPRQAAREPAGDADLGRGLAGALAPTLGLLAGRYCPRPWPAQPRRVLAGRVGPGSPPSATFRVGFRPRP